MPVIRRLRTTLRWFASNRRGISKFLLATVPGVILLGLAVNAITDFLDDDEVVFPSSAEEQIANDVPAQSTVRDVQRLYLRDAATPSYFVIVRHPAPKAKLPPWDELRIYDAAGSSVKLALAIQPLSLIGGPPTVRYADIRWGVREGRMYQFRLIRAEDTNDDGRSEIYGVFADQISSIQRPVAISWNSSTGQYELSALISSPPRGPIYFRGLIDPAHWARREARTGLRLALSPGDRETTIYGATQSVLRRLPKSGWFLVNGHAAQLKSVLVNMKAQGKRATGKGLAFTDRFGYSRRPEISLLTIDVFKLEIVGGAVGAVPCDIYATSRIRPGLVVPKLTANALVKRPMAARRLRLGDHVFC